MSDHGRDKVADCLSSRQDMSLANMKFFRGYGDVISPEELREEVCAAIAARVGAGDRAVSAMPRSSRETVDVRAWVADM